jgi:hypothetical protein
MVQYTFVTLRITLRTTSIHTVVPVRSYVYIYCVRRHNGTVFVFATFCTIMSTPHLVGGPTGF